MDQAQNSNLVRKPTPWFMVLALVLGLLSLISSPTTSVNHTAQYTKTELYQHASTSKRLACYHDQSDLSSIKDYSSVNCTPALLVATYSQKASVQFKKYAKNLNAIQFQAFMPYTPRSMTESFTPSLRG
ncbi:MAG: hypothetical protein JNK44_04425 [Cyclobacteriaceae bacterium]|nr:hypothetical protein [Cyclobacteriaceae bacterium]